MRVECTCSLPQHNPIEVIFGYRTDGVFSPVHEDVLVYWVTRYESGLRMLLPNRGDDGCILIGPRLLLQSVLLHYRRNRAVPLPCHT